MRVPVLTYHAAIITGDGYGQNDHVGLAADLDAIHAMGKRIIPLHWLVDAFLRGDAALVENCVALSCDDGSALDHDDVVHPEFGPQRSFRNILLDFRQRHGADAQPFLHLTSFVIADPAARRVLDRRALFGVGWMDDHWWREAEHSGLMSVENHSWDHNHGCLDGPGPYGIERGAFSAVETAEQAEFEITQAQQCLQRALAPKRPSLFCYPFGESSEFLRTRWLPTRGVEIGLVAAFGSGGEPVTLSSDRWNLPRLVSGWHWKTPAELAGIVAG